MIKDYLDAVGITQADDTERKTFTQKVFDSQVGQTEKRKNTRRVWYDERKRAYSETMKQLWAQNKANQQGRFRGELCFADWAHS